MNKKQFMNHFYCIFGSVNKYTHMYEIASGKRQLVINFPDRACLENCMATIKNNSYEMDELSASGLHYHDGSKVKAPVVEECFLNLECEVEWEKELFEGSLGKSAAKMGAREFPRVLNHYRREMQ